MNLYPMLIRGEIWYPFLCEYDPRSRYGDETVFAKSSEHARELIGCRAGWLLKDPVFVKVKEVEHVQRT